MGKIGRPEEDDSEPLYAMAEIVHNNPEMNLASVIRLVIQSMTSFHSEEAIIKRLSRKFNRDREFLMDRVRSRQERPVVYLPPQRRRTVGVDLSMLGLHLSTNLGSGLKAAAEAAALLDTSAMVRAAERAAGLDMYGLQAAAEAMALLDTSAMVRAAERAAGLDVYGLKAAAEAAALLDTSAMVRAAERAAAGSWWLQP